MPPESERRDAATLWQIVEAARAVLRYVAGLERTAFLLDPIRLDAVIYRIMVIGEGAGRLSSATRDRFPGIPWRSIIDQRNRLIHGYDRVRVELVWELVSIHVPDLIATLEPLMPPVPPDPDPDSE